VCAYLDSRDPFLILPQKLQCRSSTPIESWDLDIQVGQGIRDPLSCPLRGILNVLVFLENVGFQIAGASSIFIHKSPKNFPIEREGP